MNLRAKLQELRESGQRIKVFVDGVKYPLKGIISEVGDDYVKVGESLIAVRAINAVIPINEPPERHDALPFMLRKDPRISKALERFAGKREDEALPEAPEGDV